MINIKLKVKDAFKADLKWQKYFNHIEKNI